MKPILTVVSQATLKLTLAIIGLTLFYGVMAIIIVGSGNALHTVTTFLGLPLTTTHIQLILIVSLVLIVIYGNKVSSEVSK